MKYIGERIPRKEDIRLVSGKGRYIDDISLPDTLYVSFVRSPYAHARILHIDPRDVYDQDGAAKVFMAADFDDIVKPLPMPTQSNLRSPVVGCLARDRVRFAGEAVAAVVSQDKSSADDLAELVSVEYDQLKTLVDAEEAMKPGATLLYEDWGSNVSFYKKLSTGDVDVAFSKAGTVLRERIRVQRHTCVPMETRGYLASYDPRTDGLTVWLSGQSAHGERDLLAKLFGMPAERVRVIVGDVGGSFGLKAHLFPEELAVCAISRLLGRPVKWIEQRTEHLAASIHARDQVHYIELASDREGRILGVRDKIVVDIGAYGASPYGGARFPSYTPLLLPGSYRITAYEVELYSVVTNKCPYGAMRGPGMLEANFVIERSIDLLSRRLKLDPSEVRMTNVIQEDAYSSPSGAVYEAGSFRQSLERLLDTIRYDELRKEQRESWERGEYLGIGLALLVEIGAPTEAMGSIGYEFAKVRVNAHGRVELLTGATPQGQGLETALAQVVAEELGVPIDDVTVIYGDTQTIAQGTGTWASRSAVLAGNAALEAAQKLKEKLRVAGAYILDAKPEDIETEGSEIFLRRDAARRTTLLKAAKVVGSSQSSLPKEILGGLEAESLYSLRRPCTSSNAAHAALVRVDAETGTVSVERYFVVEDCGVIINPMLVEGQVHGGVVQGMGGTLLEELRYNDSGQLLTSTLMDYLLPTALDSPQIQIEHLVTPSETNPAGFKGMAEGGNIASLAAIANAVEDALQPFRVKITELPLSPERVWLFINQRNSQCIS